MKKLDILLYMLKKSGFNEGDIIRSIYLGAEREIELIKNLRDHANNLARIIELDQQADLYRDILDYIIALYE